MSKKKKFWSLSSFVFFISREQKSLLEYGAIVLGQKGNVLRIGIQSLSLFLSLSSYTVTHRSNRGYRVKSLCRRREDERRFFSLSLRRRRRRSERWVVVLVVLEKASFDGVS